MLIVISAPSGSGKTTVAHEILRRHPEMRFSVSATTRSRREREVDGKDYFFLTRNEFEQNISAGRMVEWEEIYGFYYGTLRSEVEKAFSTGQPMLFDVDVKGALSIKAHYPQESVLIFVKPPSMEALEDRLTRRQTENAETIRKRLDRVPMEMSAAEQFDHVVVNDDLQTAVAEVDAIVTAALQQRIHA